LPILEYAVRLGWSKNHLAYIKEEKNEQKIKIKEKQIVIEKRNFFHIKTEETNSFEA